MAVPVLAWRPFPGSECSRFPGYQAPETGRYRVVKKTVSHSPRILIKSGGYCYRLPGKLAVSQALFRETGANIRERPRCAPLYRFRGVEPLFDAGLILKWQITIRII